LFPETARSFSELIIIITRTKVFQSASPFAHLHLDWRRPGIIII
jgi:hypothetical protein